MASSDFLVRSAGIFVLCIVAAHGSSRVEEDKINVHIVPHTHDDVGWLSTVDQYYVSGVQYILDTVVNQLLMNKERKFIYVEIAYFVRWWEEQTVEKQGQVRELVRNGQLEFINAGWCMNDEATTHYNAMIDQMSLGLRFVEQTFGPEARPRVAWHIDPFGHSEEQATLFAMMGFDGFFLGRIDYQDRAKRWKDMTMEMVWRGSTSLKENSDIFTGVLFLNYDPPPGFCFDIDCFYPTSIQDDPRLFDYNVDEKVRAFVLTAKNQAMKYATNNIMMTFGGDFRYKDADISFKNIDKLIQYVNEDGQVNALYSTPSIYLDSLHSANKTWTLKTDDFFPYADGVWSYWTGYFTSRPAFKRYVRKMNNLLQACKQLETWSTIPGLSSVTLQRAMAVVQHHDAVSGTEKQLVANDYAKRLHLGQVECTNLMGQAISTLAAKNPTTLKFQYCEYLNISVCNATQNSPFHLALYNPLARNWTGIVRIPVSSTAFQAFGQNNKNVATQVIPVSSATKSVRNNKGNAQYELLIEVAGENAIPAAGFTMLLVKEVKRRLPHVRYQPYHHGEDLVIQNEYTSVTVSGKSGLLSSIKNLPLDRSMEVQQQFLWYNSSSGNNYNSSQASGAYIFRPNNTNNEAYLANKSGTAVVLNVYKGDLVQEIHQSFTEDNLITQVIRVYKGIPGVEFEYTVGPIPVRDGLGKEIISRFSTGLKSAGEWYTDANGRQMQYRRRNFRPTWKWNNTEPIAGNYYPVNSRIFIRDNETGMQFTILTDRSQGGSSLKDGDVELMIHRRCLYDDGRGVSEPLNETGQFGDGLIIRGRHHVLFDTVQNSTYWHRMLGERMMMEPILFFAPTEMNYSEMKNNLTLQYNGLAKDLPESVHLLTVEHLEDKKMLLRLENHFQADEPVVNSMNTNVTVDVARLFSSIQVKEMTELSLGGNAMLSSISRLHWDIVPNDLSTSGSKGHYPEPLGGGSMSVNLFPMDIRTFNITYE